jgi:Fe-S-cluster containining protein
MRCGGHCCDEAHPPISNPCHQRLIAAGVSPDSFEVNGYRRLKTNPDGTCILMKEGKCTIHDIKPETCRAGPFTFDVMDDQVQIFLKFESLCPIVGLLKEVPSAYNQQYEQSVRNIAHLVSNLSREELTVISRIEEPDTEKVAEIPVRDIGSYVNRH